LWISSHRKCGRTSACNKVSRGGLNGRVYGTPQWPGTTGGGKIST
jgi:hypothetical protein